MQRRSRIAIVALALTAVLGAAVAYAPAALRHEAEARLAARIPGSTARVGDVGLGAELVALDDVEITAPGLRVRVQRTELHVSPMDLLWVGASAIRRIAATGTEVEIHTNELVLPRRQSDGAVRDSDDGEQSLTIDVLDARIEVHDEAGPLATVEQLEVHRDEGLRFLARGVTVGDSSEGASAASASASVSDGRLEAASLEDAVLRAGADGSMGPLVERLRAAVAALRPAREAPAEGGAAETGLGRLGDAFVGELRSVAIEQSGPDGSRRVLEGLSARVERRGVDSLATTGNGRPDGGGSLAWDLSVEPGARRASGAIELDGVALAVLTPFLPSLPLHEPEHTRVSGRVRLETREDGIHGDVELRLRELAAFHPRIATTPVQHVEIGLVGSGVLLRDGQRLELSALTLTMGAAALSLAGALEWAEDHYLVDVDVRLPITPCDAAVHAIPADLLGELSALRMEGSIGGRLRVRVDSRALDETQLRIEVADACRFVEVPAMADVARFAAPFVHRVVEPDDSISELTTGPGTAAWTPIAEISPFMLHAVLAHEDASFFSHHGFAPWAIRDALVRNLRERRYVLGASTITMQLVKNVFLHREKTVARKVQEVLLTWWVESSMTKEQILELYLNVIEYGPHVYGIRDAAWHYFGRTPAELSAAEAAYLALILPNPPAFHEHWEEGRPPRAFAARVGRFVRLMHERGRIDAAAMEDGVAQASALSFHREDDPPAEPRPLVGSATELPLTGALVVRGWDDETLEDAPPEDDAWDEPLTP